MAKSVVIVTDWITIDGGGEKVVEAFHKLYPEARIYTSYCSDVWRKRLDGKVVTGYLQNWPFSKLRRFLPLLRQWWFAQLDLSDYDTIISISGNGEAKFVRKNEKQTHICYCHTPVHFYWAQYNNYLKNPSMRPKWLARLGLRLLVNPLRKRDYAASQNVDYFIANSFSTQADIKKYYDRDSEVIHPPVKIANFIHLSPRGEMSISSKPECLMWGRLVPAKCIDIAIKACNELKWPLTIIGDGPELPYLKSIAGPTVSLLGYVNDDEREAYIRKAELFLFCAREDFGVAPVESLAAGMPVVAYRSGGALDYIEEGVSGVFFDRQTVPALVETLKGVVGMKFTAESVSSIAHKFSADSFSEKTFTFIKTRIKD